MASFRSSVHLINNRRKFGRVSDRECEADLWMDYRLCIMVFYICG